MCSSSSLSVARMGCWDDKSWRWDLGVDESVLVREVDVEWMGLMELLVEVNTVVDVFDKVVWWRNDEGFFSENSYRWLYSLKHSIMELDGERFLS